MDGYSLYQKTDTRFFNYIALELWSCLVFTACKRASLHRFYVALLNNYIQFLDLLFIHCFRRIMIITHPICSTCWSIGFCAIFWPSLWKNFRHYYWFSVHWFNTI